MPQTIHEPKRAGGYTWADDVADADRECGKRRRLYQVRCQACKKPCMLHCDECRIQVTGCICTLIERMGPIEAYKTLAKQVGQTKAREQFLAYGYNMPLLPGLSD